jgi:hypothetical protein
MVAISFAVLMLVAHKQALPVIGQEAQAEFPGAI